MGLGLWYQMYSDSFVTNTFEKNAFCDTAMYTKRDDGKIGVRNYAKQGQPDASGTDYVIDGYAYQSNSEVAGELKVHFNPTDGQNVAPFDAAYWILNLGPVNKDGKYDWAVVSDNLSKFLFVLARDVKTFASEYEAEVLEIPKKEGFTGTFTTPIKTYQGDDCVYESSVAAPKPKAAAASSTCEGITNKDTCMSSMEGDEACAWCESGAVGTSCQKQSDAESLPAAVFACEYQQAYAAYTAPSKPKKDTDCSQCTGDGPCAQCAQCTDMKDGPCAPCWSDDNAAGQACLPACSSCYTVDHYIKTMYGLGATKKDSATCDGITDEKTCMSSSEGSEACAWCSSGAVGP